MNIRTITARAAVAGATTALAAGALVGLGASAANAATVSNDYTCTSVAGTFPSTVTVTGDLPVKSYYAGAKVAPGLVQAKVSATVPAQVATVLGSFGATGAHSDNYGFALGKSRVPVPVSGDFVTDDEGATTWEAAGKNGAFVTPGAGQVDARLPKSFTLTVPTETMGDVTATCALTEGQTPQTIASVLLVQQQSKVTGPAKAMKVKKTKAVKIPVTVTADSGPVVIGKVVAKEGKKTLKTTSVKDGKATLDLGKLKVGKHTIKVSYLTNPSIKGSTDTVTVNVTKG